MTQPLKKHWDMVGAGYDKYWQSQGKQMLLRKELDFITHYLTPVHAKDALDIGIGSGRILENYHRQISPKYIDGIDIAQAMVDVCRKRFMRSKRVRTLAVCNIATQNLPFPARYDFVSAIRVLKYNKNWKEIINKIFGYLKNEGVLVFSMPNKHAFIRFTPTDTQQYYTTVQEIQDCVRSCGFTLLEITSFSKIPDIFYDFVDTPKAVHLLSQSEKLLEKIGKNVGGKEFFVAVQKTLLS